MPPPVISPNTEETSEAACCQDTRFDERNSMTIVINSVDGPQQTGPEGRT